jgi:hypothetical protein
MTMHEFSDYFGRGCAAFVGLQSAGKPARAGYPTRAHPIERRLQHTAAGMRTFLFRYRISRFRLVSIEHPWRTVWHSLCQEINEA